MSNYTTRNGYPIRLIGKLPEDHVRIEVDYTKGYAKGLINRSRPTVLDVPIGYIHVQIGAELAFANDLQALKAIRRP